MPKNSILVDPRFVDPEGGDFTSQEEELKMNKQGLSNPSLIRDLWQKWNALSIPGKEASADLQPAP